MTALLITGFYASLLGILFIGLSIKIILLRRQFKVGIGDGEQQPLATAIRVHGNFSEYIPLALLLLACYELNQGSVLMLHIAGSLLVLGRLAHASGLSKSIGVTKGRQGGMLATFLVILVLAFENIRMFILA